MARVPALLVIRIATLVALAASAALAVEYRSLDSAFCGARSGCAALRQTGIAYLWGAGVSLPQAAMLILAAVFALSLTRAAVWSARLLLPGGLIALGLLAAQAFWLKQFCWLCVTTDLSMLVAASASLLFLLRDSERSRALPLKTWAWGVLAAVAVVAPTLWPQLRPLPPVPESIRAYYENGKINVVEFADYECPFCRELHGRLHALLKPYGSKVHFVRLNMPLERHPFAHDAALAALCSEPSGKSDALAEFMFTTEDLSVRSIRAEVERLGIPVAAFDACLAAPTTKLRLEREIKALRDAGFEGLPTTYVGGRRIVGALGDDSFRSALDHAAAGDDIAGIPAWAYLLGVAMVIAFVIRLGERGEPKVRSGGADASTA